MGLDQAWAARQFDPRSWWDLRVAIASVISTRTRDEWASMLDGTDACVAPVLTMDEAPTHPQLAFRQTFVTIDGLVQAAPAPRFSRT